MFYYLYEVRNNINGKTYIGVHETENLNDGYMGSGTLIKRAIRKYGVENFSKVILQQFSTREEMFSKEKEIVDSEYILDPTVYNLMPGGKGGFGYINESGRNGTAMGVQRRLELLNDTTWMDFWLAQQRKGCVERISKTPAEVFSKAGTKANKTCLERTGKYSFQGKTHSDETKKIISEKNSQRMRGKGNSQFGTMWITDGNNNKKIKNTDPIPQGWKKGRLCRE
jgi:GIY-YIG catalytic domain